MEPEHPARPLSLSSTDKPFRSPFYAEECSRGGHDDDDDDDDSDQDLVGDVPMGATSSYASRTSPGYSSSEFKQRKEDLSTISTSHSANSAQSTKIEQMLLNISNRIDTLEKRSNNSNTRPCSRDQGSYCWSHGYHVAANHNSKNCRNKKPGHQDEATRDNPMNGSTYGKPKS